MFYYSFFRKAFGKGKKGVSPLVAAVLLIAFTMAIAAMLVAWITSFTQQQRAQTAVFEEKVKCSQASILIMDSDFVQYDSLYPKAGNNYSVLSLRIQNNGASEIILNGYQVKYQGVATPVVWSIRPQINIPRTVGNNTITALFPVSNSGNNTIPDSNRPERIRVNTVCGELAYAEISGPFGGPVGRVADLDARTLTFTSTPDANVSNFVVADLPIGP